MVGLGVAGLGDGAGMLRVRDGSGDLLGGLVAGGEMEIGFLRMLSGGVLGRPIGNGDDDRGVRGPRGRCMMVSLLSIAASVVVKVTM